MRWRIIRFQTDDAHMRIYAVADQDKYLIHIYQKLKNERDIFFKLVNCCIWAIWVQGIENKGQNESKMAKNGWKYIDYFTFDVVDAHHWWPSLIQMDVLKYTDTKMQIQKYTNAGYSIPKLFAKYIKYRVWIELTYIPQLLAGYIQYKYICLSFKSLIQISSPSSSITYRWEHLTIIGFVT